MNIHIVVDDVFAENFTRELNGYLAKDNEAISVRSWSPLVTNLHWIFRESMNHVSEISDYFDPEDSHAHLMMNYTTRALNSLDSMREVHRDIIQNHLADLIPKNLIESDIRQFFSTFFTILLNTPEQIDCSIALDILGFDDDVKHLDEILSTCIETLRNFIISNKISDGNLLINHSLLDEFTGAVLPLIISKLTNFQNMILFEAGITPNDDLFTHTVNSVNKVKASNAAKAKAKKQKFENLELKESVIKSYLNPNLAKKDKWKSRNEFSLWFTMNHNNRSNEDQWIKDYTVKKWVKEYLEK